MSAAPYYSIAGGRLVGVRWVNSRRVAFRFAARFGCWVEELPTQQYGQRWTNTQIRAAIAKATGSAV